jgi:prophage regulatory protein
MSIPKSSPRSIQEVLAQPRAGSEFFIESLSPFAQSSNEQDWAGLITRLQLFINSTILRLPVVLHERGDIGRSKHYEDIKQRLFTPGVPIGTRAVGWPAYEVALLNAARIAGNSEDEIRALVVKLIEARKARAWGRGHD